MNKECATFNISTGKLVFTPCFRRELRALRKKKANAANETRPPAGQPNNARCERV